MTAARLTFALALPRVSARRSPSLKWSDTRLTRFDTMARPPCTTVAKYGITTSRAPLALARLACTSKVAETTTSSPESVQLERTFVKVATTSMDRESRLAGGSNRVMSAVWDGTATAGQAFLLMMIPPDESKSPWRAHPASKRPHVAATKIGERNGTGIILEQGRLPRGIGSGFRACKQSRRDVRIL